MLFIDRALETSYISAGIANAGERSLAITMRDRLGIPDFGAEDFALLSTAEVALLPETHRVDPLFGIWSSESGAIAMRSMVRPDGVEDAAILLYDISGTAELLARATIWPYYGIRAARWTTELDGNSAITIVDGISALESVEAGFSEDLVRAWYILTEQPVVTHLLAVPAETTPAELIDMHELLNGAVATGIELRRDIRKALLADSSAEGDRLVDFFSNLRYELDDTARIAAYSLIARGSGGTRFPLIREIPWWTPAAEAEDHPTDAENGNPPTP